jgi:hypothetical protein
MVAVPVKSSPLWEVPTSVIEKDEGSHVDFHLGMHVSSELDNTWFIHEIIEIQA